MDPASVYSFSRSKNTSTSWSSSTTASFVSCGVEVTNNSFDMLSPVLLGPVQHRRDLGRMFKRTNVRACPCGLRPDGDSLDGSIAQIRCTFACGRSAWCGRTRRITLGSGTGAVTHPGISFFFEPFRPGTALCRRSCPFKRKGERQFSFGPASISGLRGLVHETAHSDVHHNTQRQEHEQH